MSEREREEGKEEGRGEERRKGREGKRGRRETTSARARAPAKMLEDGCVSVGPHPTFVETGSCSLQTRAYCPRAAVSTQF